jgi:hypothetical protein
MMLSNTQLDALNKDHVVGRDAYFNDPVNGDRTNPYPPQSDYYEAFQEGFEEEKDRHEK